MKQLASPVTEWGAQAAYIRRRESRPPQWCPWCHGEKRRSRSV